MINGLFCFEIKPSGSAQSKPRHEAFTKQVKTQWSPDWLIGWGSDVLPPALNSKTEQEKASMRKVLLSLVAVSLIAIPVFAGKYNKAISVGDKAPDFSGLPAVSNGEDTSLSLVDQKEDIVVVAFLANHCPVVQEYEDRLIDFVNAYKDKGVKVIGISVNDIPMDKIPGIKKYTKDHKSNYIYGYDESQAVGHAYGATNTPQFFVLDKERKIRYTGTLDDNQKEAKVTKTYLRDAVDALLKGQTPPVEETRPQGCGVKYKKS